MHHAKLIYKVSKTTVPVWIESVPEGQIFRPFRNTRQPQSIEHKRCTDIPHSQRADKITLWAHQTGHNTDTHSLSAQRSRSSIAFAKIDHRTRQTTERTIGLATIDATTHMSRTHVQNTMETFSKGRNPDPLGTQVSHNRLNISAVQTHPIPEGQTKSPFGYTQRDTPHTPGYTTATNSLSTSLAGPEYTPLKPNLGIGTLSIFSTKILRIQSFTLYLHPLSKSAQQKRGKIWVWSGSSAG